MPIKLNQPLEARNPDADEQALLNDLQGNILKGHGREHTTNLFVRFDKTQAAAAKVWIKTLAAKVTSSAAQLAMTIKRKAALKKDKKGKAPQSAPVVFFFLTSTGYDALGVAANRRPKDGAFTSGQKASQGLLNDPLPSKWDAPFSQEIHAMILVGGEDLAQVNKERTAILASLPAAVSHVGEERGRAWKNENGDGIEHFGYVDGRSQPLLLVQDVENEQNSQDGISVWDPAFPISQVLVSDPAGKDNKSFGSYFVFRKLEQNVKGFKDREEQIAEDLELSKEDAERVGAMLVGRFEDGTPVVLQSAEGMHNPVPNNFDYRNDPNALKCPFHSHIRKTNPRGESVRPGLAPNLASERAHIMARRGITYGARKVKAVGEGVEFADKPTGGVGLIFMAYQSNIANQFEFTQATWANNLNFVNPGTGIDPVIGQGAKGGQSCPVKWGGDPATAKFQKFDFRHFVTMKGGGYFFAPSISALKSL